MSFVVARKQCGSKIGFDREAVGRSLPTGEPVARRFLLAPAAFVGVVFPLQTVYPDIGFEKTITGKGLLVTDLAACQQKRRQA